MRFLTLLRLFWRRIRRVRKVYNLVDKQRMELLGKRDNIRATASTYLSFNRPLPPSEEYFLHRSTSTILDRCYLFTSSACPNDTEYWEIDDTIADDKKEYVLTETEGTAVLKRFNATSDLQPTFTNAAKNNSMFLGLIDALKTSIKSPRKRPLHNSLFIPVCSSTPLCISSESVSILPNNNENISGYYRSLDKHVSIPKFPPPPPPVEEFKEDTMVMIDSDDFALWEIENCRTCVDSMSPDLSLCEESIILTDNEVDLNETFIEEMTFYVDRPPSEMSVLRVYSKTNPSKFEEIFFLSESIEV